MPPPRKVPSRGIAAPLVGDLILLFTEGPEEHNIHLLRHHHDPIRYLHIVIMAICYFESFPDEVI